MGSTRLTPIDRRWSQSRDDFVCESSIPDGNTAPTAGGCLLRNRDGGEMANVREGGETAMLGSNLQANTQRKTRHDRSHCLNGHLSRHLQAV